MKQWISQQSMAFYVMAVITVIGVIMTAAANSVYKRLIKEADSVEESTNRLVKYIKLKYSSYYKIGLKPNDMKAMVHKYLHKYRLGPVSLKAWTKAGVLAAGIVGVTAMTGILMGFYEGKKLSDMYVLLIEAVFGIFVLAIQHMLCDFKEKQENFCFAMYDYLANFLKNKIENGKTALSGESGNEETESSYKSEREKKGSTQAAATSVSYGKKSLDKAFDSSRLNFDDDEIDAKIVEDILKEFLI